MNQTDEPDNAVDLEGQTLTDFPCLKHAHVFAEGEGEEDQTYVCIAPDGHEDAHDFVPSTSLMFSLKDASEVAEEAVN